MTDKLIETIKNTAASAAASAATSLINHAMNANSLTAKLTIVIEANAELAPAMRFDTAWKTEHKTENKDTLMPVFYDPNQIELPYGDEE